MAKKKRSGCLVGAILIGGLVIAGIVSAIIEQAQWPEERAGVIAEVKQHLEAGEYADAVKIGESKSHMDDDELDRLTAEAQDKLDEREAAEAKEKAERRAEAAKKEAERLRNQPIDQKVRRALAKSDTVDVDDQIRKIEALDEFAARVTFEAGDSFTLDGKRKMAHKELAKVMQASFARVPELNELTVVVTASALDDYGNEKSVRWFEGHISRDEASRANWKNLKADREMLERFLREKGRYRIHTRFK